MLNRITLLFFQKFLGWNPISSFDNSSIEANYLTGSNAYSDYDKLKIIWNRILKTLPLIYKTKGTEECIAAGNKIEEEYWDKRQLVKKINLNSLYGAILNPGCRFCVRSIACICM